MAIKGDWMEYFSLNPNDRNTWLVSGIDYDFGYDHKGTPSKVRWEDYETTGGCGCSELHEWGEPDKSPWGRGKVVYGEPGQPGRKGVVDPMQWPGWDNGGDGWVLAPAHVPEPSSTLGLLALGTLGAGSALKRNKKQNPN